MSQKPTSDPDNEFIANQLLRCLGDMSYRAIASSTNHNSETVRRYIGNTSKVSASFIKQASEAFEIDANLLLHGRPAPAEKRDLRSLSTELFFQELARRVGLIEDTLVGLSIQDRMKKGIEDSEVETLQESTTDFIESRGSASVQA